MIYLIGGPPKCGKTTLAKVLSKVLGIPWISADTLQNVVRAYMDEKDQAKYFPHSNLKGSSNDETYSQNSAEKIVHGYVEQGKTSHKAIGILVETMIVDQDDFIIEGYQVTPEIADEAIRKFGPEYIKTVFLVKHDEKKFVDDLHKSTTRNDWVIRKTKDESVYGKIAHMVSVYSKYFEKEGNKHGFRVVVMDEDFEDKVKESVEYLTPPEQGERADAHEFADLP